MKTFKSKNTLFVIYKPFLSYLDLMDQKFRPAENKSSNFILIKACFLCLSMLIQSGLNIASVAKMSAINVGGSISLNPGQQVKPSVNFIK